MALFEEMRKNGNFLFKYRGTLPVFILVVGFLVFVLDRLHPGEPPLGSPYDYFCLLVGLLGLGIRIFTIGHSAPKTSGRNTEDQVADEINTSGIYSIVRHPLYVGNFFMWLSIGMLTHNLWFVISFIFIYWVYYERIMLAEEEYLRDKFGARYENWAAETPAFVPSLKNYRKPKYGFNFKKVTVKEKNGILALCLIFFFFLKSGAYLRTGDLTFNYDFWTIIAIISVVYYFIVKLVRKNTALLNYR